MGEQQPSEWQKKITGEWHGRPSLFDADGDLVRLRGHPPPAVFEDGETRYWMDDGPVRGRRAPQPVRARRAVRLRGDRLRRQPGLHRPGLLRHRPAVRLLRRRALLLDRAGRSTCAPGTTSCRRRDPGVLLGAARRLDHVCGCFNGVYKVRPTRHRPRDQGRHRRLDRRRDAARPGAARPAHQAGRRCTGVFEVYGADQKLRGNTLVHGRARAADAAAHRADRSPGTAWAQPPLHRRAHPRRQPTDYDGPDACGNARAYGRARSTSGTSPAPDVWKIKGREFLDVDESRQLAVTWMSCYEGDVLDARRCTALLEWEATPMSAGRRVVVVTGATRGIGLGLAQELLDRGAPRRRVCGRSQESVDKALAALDARRPAVGGRRRRHRPRDDLPGALGPRPSTAFGRVDIWVNNAGMSPAAQAALGAAARQTCRHRRHQPRRASCTAPRSPLRGMLAQGGGAWSGTWRASAPTARCPTGLSAVRRDQARASPTSPTAPAKDLEAAGSPEGRRAPPVARHRRHRPARRRLRGPAGEVREGQEVLQHPRRQGRDGHAVARRAASSPTAQRRPGRVADHAQGGGRFSTRSCCSRSATSSPTSRGRHAGGDAAVRHAPEPTSGCALATCTDIVPLAAVDYVRVLVPGRAVAAAWLPAAHAGGPPDALGAVLVGAGGLAKATWKLLLVTTGAATPSGWSRRCSRCWRPGSSSCSWSLLSGCASARSPGGRSPPSWWSVAVRGARCPAACGRCSSWPPPASPLVSVAARSGRRRSGHEAAGGRLFARRQVVGSLPWCRCAAPSTTRSPCSGSRSPSTPSPRRRFARRRLADRCRAHAVPRATARRAHGGNRHDRRTRLAPQVRRPRAQHELDRRARLQPDARAGRDRALLAHPHHRPGPVERGAAGEAARPVLDEIDRAIDQV